MNEVFIKSEEPPYSYRNMLVGGPVYVYSASSGAAKWEQISPFRPHGTGWLATLGAILRGEQSGFGAVSQIWDGRMWWPAEQTAGSATWHTDSAHRWVFGLNIHRDPQGPPLAGVPKVTLQQGTLKIDSTNPHVTVTRVAGDGLRVTVSAAGAAFLSAGGFTKQRDVTVGVDGQQEYGPIQLQVPSAASVPGAHVLTPTWIITPRGGTTVYPGGPTSHMGENPNTDLLATFNVPGTPKSIVFANWGIHGLKTSRGMPGVSIRPASQPGDSVRYQVNGGPWHIWGGGAGGVDSINVPVSEWHAGVNKVRVRPPVGVSMWFGNPGHFEVFQIQATV